MKDGGKTDPRFPSPSLLRPPSFWEVGLDGDGANVEDEARLHTSVFSSIFCVTLRHAVAWI